VSGCDDSVIIQGLVGRMCGYVAADEPAGDSIIYTNIDSIYEALFEARFKITNTAGGGPRMLWKSRSICASATREYCNTINDPRLYDKNIVQRQEQNNNTYKTELKQFSTHRRRRETCLIQL